MKIHESITGAEHIEFDEDRIDIIGSNGNDGTHYVEIDRVIAVIRDSLGLEKNGVVGPNTTLRELQVDSLDLLELVMALEDHFSIHIEDSLATNWETVGDLIKEIEKCLSK